MSADISPESIDAIAERVVELLRDGDRDPDRLVSAGEIATRFSISVDTVYENADDWGAVRIGKLLRFDPAVVLERTGARPDPRTKPPAPRRRRAGNGSADLLPIRGTTP